MFVSPSKLELPPQPQALELLLQEQFELPSQLKNLLQ